MTEVQALVNFMLVLEYLALSRIDFVSGAGIRAHESSSSPFL
jgi:hypothetical protein